jgi:5'-nucleotidase/UDP-sugar diphosphatase
MRRLGRRMVNKITLIGNLLLFFFLFLGSSLSYGEETLLTLIYSSNTLGEVVPCGCIEAGNAGGLSRRSHYINTVRNEGIKTLILDGGDVLAIGQPGNERERQKARERAEFILKLYGKMGYDAVNIGDTDLVLGLEYLRALQKHSPVPLLSANLKDKKTRKTLFKPYLVKQVHGLKVGIIGLITKDIRPYMLNGREGYFVEDSVKTVTNTINGVLLDCDIIIALAHLNHSEIDSLAQKVPKISIIIGGHDRAYMDVKMINRSLWVQTDAFGFQIGKLDLKWVKGSSDFQYENVLTVLQPEMKTDPQIERIIASSGDILKRPLP